MIFGGTTPMMQGAIGSGPTGVSWSFFRAALRKASRAATAAAAAAGTAKPEESEKPSGATRIEVTETAFIRQAGRVTVQCLRPSPARYTAALGLRDDAPGHQGGTGWRGNR